MTMYELVDGAGDSGMFVIGASDEEFRREADRVGRPDERLLTVDVATLKDPDLQKIAAASRLGAVLPIEVEQIPTEETER